MYIKDKSIILALTAAFFSTLSIQGLAQEAELEEIVVTGSRLSTAGGFNTPTPVTAISADDLKAIAPGNIGDALAEMPSMATSTPSSAGGAGSFAGGDNANGQAFLNLRGLGSNRTLILLNGQRYGSTNANGTVDVNQIPHAIVRRVDVVTGGASASYGSDAVAGVINFVLDTDYEGMKFDLSTGRTDKSDGDEVAASMAFGKQYDRGRIIGAVDFYTQDGIGLGPTGRAWHDVPTGGWLYDGMIRQLPDARSGTASDGGHITRTYNCTTPACSALTSLQFVENGDTAPWVAGDFPLSNGQYASGGSGSRKINGIGPSRDRKSIFLHGEYDLTSEVTVWGQTSLNLSKTDLEGQPVYHDRGRGMIIQEGNPFIPDDVAAILAADPGNQRFMVERYFYDAGTERNRVGNDDETYRVAIGLRGDQTARWSWDASMYHQETESYVQQIVYIPVNLHHAVDVVLDGSGNPACYITEVIGKQPDCVPLNPFGYDAVSLEASQYINGRNWQRNYFAQSGFEANVRGDLGDFTMTTDPISIAAGFSFYRNSVRRETDARSGITPNCNNHRFIPGFWCNNYYAYGNPSPFPTGEVSVSEVFGEAGIPLVRDAAGVQALDLSLAARSTNYSQSGTVYTWKTGLNWEINDAWRIRATQSRDIRAPSGVELFETGSSVIGNSQFPTSDPAFAEFIPPTFNTVRGNPALGPEKADTTVFGVVWRPSNIDLQVSVDYYKIEIEDAIAQVGAQTIVDLCYQGNAQACTLISVGGAPITDTRDVNPTDLVEILDGPINIAVADTSGIDFEMIYRTELGAGNLTIRGLANHLLEFDNTEDEGCAIQVGGIVGGGGCGTHPEWVGQFNLGYTLGNFGMNIRQRYIHSGLTDPNLVEGVDINENDVPRVMYTDLRFSYDLGEAFGTSSSSVFFNVTNLFDKEPPATSTSQRAWVVPTDYGLYDVLGLRYNLGIKAEF